MIYDSESHDSRDEKIVNEMSGHSYDGITECDNPMPGWWLWTFLLAIIFGFIYGVHYTVGGGPTLQDELKEAMSVLEKSKTHAPMLQESEETLTSEMAKDNILPLGATVYAEKCAACHGSTLQGLIGPNLTDSYWLHGKATRQDIVRVIRQGVTDKGMPAWDQVLNKNEIYALTAFILSKKGSNPSQAKAPQGDQVQ